MILTTYRFANSLTIFRATICMTILLNLQHHHRSWAWIFLLLGGITDILDGVIIRKAEKSSIWGATIDPLTDKLLVFVPIIWLTYQGVLPICAIWGLLARELLISTWRGNQRNGGPASRIGKYKTVVQFTSLLLLIFPVTWFKTSVVFFFHGLGWLLFWFSMILALYSAFEYLEPRLNQKRASNL
uniref:CDP-diacylglycerol-glycerol-3-phosphate 3-phosphatidyltransferase n=2 Tax=Paulinella micropora TaxID=1928728 RepID=A0A1L5YAY7_9EUKA|nr:CDP-diacylglycerol-glycerol-3-phosphate 3-phosphatidyltransferase [Paulinella micropora]AQX44633.1 CDP-diacylglycerol-glycerol-3-phosphate 3-phosphatidyltransferase [Paulinella micropora]